MATRTEKITEVLRGLRVSSPDIIGAAVVSIDGFVIASIAPTEIDEELVAGMSAALLGAGFLYFAAHGLRRSVRGAWARRTFAYSLVYLSALIVMLMVDAR